MNTILNNKMERKIILPDEIFGRKTAGAMEKVLKGNSQTQVSEQTAPQVNAPDLKDYIWVPSIKLYVAKERDLNGLSWNQATDKIYNQGINVAGQRAEMPTPFEFISYLKYLLSGNIKGLAESERQNILNDILKIGKYIGNWLNAKFVEQNKGFNNFGIETLTLDSSGKPAKKVEPLEPCLLQDGWADINSGNSQGLLTKSYGSSYEQGKNAYFWYPRNTAVARWGAFSVRAGLYCDSGADYSYPALGVRLVVRPKGASSKTRS